MYDPREMPAPLGNASLLADRNPFLEYVRRTHGIATLSAAAMKVIKAYYYGLVTHQDAQVGRVLEALRESGLEESTIIVYTADHGELLGDFGTYFKGSFLAGSLNVPLMVKGPQVPAGQRRRQLVGLQDILPTLAGLSDCPLAQKVHGLDLSAVLRDAQTPCREVYYSQCMDEPRQSAMVTDGQWKYIYSQEGATEQLYDLSADPDELNNLASRPDAESLLRPWRQRLREEALRLGDTGLVREESLVTSPVDRASYINLPITGMGWRKC
jgi:arylsulfatase A-like enzyme